MILAELGARDIAFYSTVATVVPVFMLAIGFQVRFSDILVRGKRPWTNRLLWALIAVLLLAMFGGEAVAVGVLSSGGANSRTHRLVLAGFGAGLASVFAGVVLTARRDWFRDRSKDKHD